MSNGRYDIDFRQIAPRCGGQREAFEELCSQLARRTLVEGADFTRLRGAGGDGGVECFADLPNGSRIGWQAKYVFDVDGLLSQAELSMATALRLHGRLTCYVVCFPFDLTGPTARRGRSGQQKFAEWRKEHESKAVAEGRELNIEAWSASKLRSLLLDLDVAGGLRAFFFDQTVLSQAWFSAHLESARVAAGPRYTPELSVETDLWSWFAAFGRTSVWSRELHNKLDPCQGIRRRLASKLGRKSSDPASPSWSVETRNEAQALVTKMQDVLEKCQRLLILKTATEYSACTVSIDDLLTNLASVESKLVNELEAQHGRGTADSPGFRQFMAGYQLSFPAGNLDRVREALTAFRELRDWLQSPSCSLAFTNAFILTGTAGSGKTHGICDAADRRFGDGMLTCICFGHAFRGEPDPWTRLLETLGLPITLGMHGLLDALNAAGEATGLPLIICIDAINETRPLRYWHDRLPAVIQAVRQRDYLRLCVSCRTSFVSSCLPERLELVQVEHQGFAGVERVAFTSFFKHYGLEPPITPILQPELANPLYLRLVCETLQARGETSLPVGWVGLAPAISAFLDKKEREFAIEHAISEGARVVGGSLRAIARAIADSGESSISWSRAQQVASECKPQASHLQVVEWLVRADLLIEDRPELSDPLVAESYIRPAFERLGDFLIASELLTRIDPARLEAAFRPEGTLGSLLKNAPTIERNIGVLSALSILIPEHRPGTEFPDLLTERFARNAAIGVTVKSLPWRDPTTFSVASANLVREALTREEFSWETIDALLSVSWQPSSIDATWFFGMLEQIPLANRDSVWCAFLHNRYESNGPVKRLIEAAFELPLDRVQEEVAERWVLALLWFTAAADRRVKDRASRAATVVLTAQPAIIPHLLNRFLDSDDDEVRERGLLTCYGAMIVARASPEAGIATSLLFTALGNKPQAFENALIRDLIRCIAELSRELGTLPDSCDPETVLQPIGSEWPLELPADEEIERWKELPALAHSCLDNDFFRYSMECLGPWEHAVLRHDMGKWILQRVAKGLAYDGSGCEQYDRYMLGTHGGGRGRPMWAERIGKKYQWIALHQLASRLNDHADRERDEWSPAPQRRPLILLDERKLDPTLPSEAASGDDRTHAWWIRPSIELGQGLDADWVTKEDDLPGLEELLKVRGVADLRWLLLASYPSWKGPKNGEDRWNNPYPYLWIRIESYLVAKNDIRTACDCLHRRNFMGRWMPEGPTWSYGFAGEYPWATPFNTEPEEWYSRGGSRANLPVLCKPATGRLAVEWEYDASLPRAFHMCVPARAFFRGDLWWNGLDGHRLIDGRTVFRDPSVAEDGPPALLGDADDILRRLDQTGLRLMWTLLGEKLIAGGSQKQSIPRRTFSQIARLKEDGSLIIGDRAFFDDYNQDIDPLPSRPQRKRTRQ